MAKKLFVGGIPYSTSEDALRAMFAKVGTVESVAIITDRMTGRSKGFGFVEMSTDAEAQAAIDSLNDTELEGRKISVKEAQPKAPREGGFGGGDRGGRGRGGY